MSRKMNKHRPGLKTRLLQLLQIIFAYYYDHIIIFRFENYCPISKQGNININAYKLEIQEGGMIGNT